MGFLEENGNSEVYKHLTKPDNTKINQGWTLYLAFCCITVCFGSFQFGYNIGSLNLVTPVIKNYFDEVYFKEVFHDKVVLFKESENKMINGINKFNDGLELFNSKKSELEDKEGQLLEGEARRDNYFDVMFSMDEEKIRNATEAKRKGEKQIRDKYNTTVEEFLNTARTKVDLGKIKLADGQKKLQNGSSRIIAGLKKLDEAKSKIIMGRKKLDTLGHIIWGFTNSLFVIGGLVGALTSKYVLDGFGRKNGILFHYLFSIIGSIIIFIPPYMNMSMFGPILLKLGRFLQGIQGGMSCNLIPTYLSEIAPSSLRGETGVIHNVFLSLGLLCTLFLGFDPVLGFSERWHFILAVPFLPAVIGGVLLFAFCEETPKFLLFEKSDEPAAIKSLQKLRNSDNVSAELTKMYVEGSEMNSLKAMSILEVLKSKELRWPLFSGMLLQFAQQFCGLNAIYFYSISIMEKAGIDFIENGVLLTGLNNVLFTLICVKLVDRLGRKPLLLSTMTIMVIDLIMLTIFLQFSENKICNGFSLACIIIFIQCFAAGLGPIPIIFVAESFKQNSRSSAMSICVFCNWFSNLFLVLLFPILIELLAGYVFVICTVVIALVTIFVATKIPETKGRSADEIQKIFNKNRNIESYELRNEINA